jgi:DNA invertase Pin-like site-specific DNA recombinase
LGKRRRKQAGNPQRAVGYVRTSREDQDLSPRAQKSALQRWADANGIALVAVFTEDVSGGAALDKRGQLLAAVDALTDYDAGVLLVLRRDRLARDNIAAAMIDRLAQRNGARVLTTDGVGNGDSPEAQLMRGVMDLFAQYERALIRARTKAALAVKRSRGERLGGQVPFGYVVGADGRSLTLDHQEQQTLTLIRRYREEGLTLQAITDRLNAERVNARGSKWHLTSVARLLRRSHPESKNHILQAES